MPVHASGSWSNNFTPTVKRFKDEAWTINDASLRKTVASLAAGAVKEARSNLKLMVYTAPLPRVVQDGRWNADEYIAKRRLGIVWRACIVNKPISMGVGIVMASAEVNRAAVEGNENTHEAFYYAYILNKGATGINYTGRPFWSDMVRVMKNTMRDYAVSGLKNTKLGLLGFDGWQYTETSWSGPSLGPGP